MERYKGFACHPTVCPVGNDYHIIVPTNFEMALSVLVDGEEYFNHSNRTNIYMASGNVVSRLWKTSNKMTFENGGWTCVMEKP